MIGVFLRAEVDSRRYGSKLLALLARDGRDADVLLRPQLDDDDANAYRRRLLDEHRSYERRDGLFDGFPRRLDWFRAALAPDEVLDVLYIDWDWWLELSGGTRRPRDAARRIRAGEVSGMSVDGQEGWRRGSAPRRAGADRRHRPGARAARARRGALPAHGVRALPRPTCRRSSSSSSACPTRFAAGGRSELGQQGAADDGRLGAGLGERGDVVGRADSARGEDAEPRTRRPTRTRPEVGAGEGAVAVDRRAEDAARRRPRGSARRRPRARAPSPRSSPVCGCCRRARRARRRAARRAPRPRRRLRERGRADDDAVGAGCEQERRRRPSSGCRPMPAGSPAPPPPRLRARARGGRVPTARRPGRRGARGARRPPRSAARARPARRPARRPRRSRPGAGALRPRRARRRRGSPRSAG